MKQIGWRVRKCRCCSKNHYWSSLCFDNYFPFVTVIILILSIETFSSLYSTFVWFLTSYIRDFHSVSHFSLLWELINTLSSIQVGEGNGTPLQYSCLENPMDGGVWWAAVHGVTRVGHDWATSLSLFTFMHWRRKWQPTPVFLPGESQGWGSLVGCRLWGHTELNTTEVT